MKLLPVFTTLLGTALSVRATAIPDTSNDNCPEACSSRYNGCMSQFPPDFVKSCQFNVCMWWKEKAACKDCAFCKPPLCTMCVLPPADAALETLEEISPFIVE